MAEESSHSDWFVLHTKSRQEKCVADALGEQGVEHFLPLVKRTRRYGHRYRTVDVPLFPSYLFMHGSADDRAVALKTNRLARVIEVREASRFESEIRAIRSAIEAGAELDPCPYLDAGTPVRVVAGPLLGLEGLVESRQSIERIVLQIEVLGRAVSAEIDAGDVERIS